MASLQRVSRGWRVPTSLRVLVLMLAVAELGASGPSVAAAQESDSGKTDYDRLVEQALSEFRLGNWTEARALFERAHELKPSARTLRAIGLAAFEEKLYAVAITHLRAALTDKRLPLTEKQSGDVERAIKRALNYIGQYKLDITPDDVEVTVRIDGREPIKNDGWLLLDPGKYQLEVTAEGYEPFRRTVAAQPREKLTLPVPLSELGQEPALAAGTQPAPPAKADEASDGLSTQQWIGIGVGAAGVVTLGVSAVFGLQAMSKDGDSGCDGGTCPDESGRKLNDEALDAGDISTVTFIAGAVVAAAGAVLFFVPFDSEQPRAETVRFAPLVSPQHAGISLGGRW